ncbi:MAG: DUF4430 domain-containing protein [Ruminococcaceae bacterium]|nr:DUF4430 domain-containing protein [Oscillospiraceae bacterium]
MFRILSVLLLLVLTAAIAFWAVACDKTNEPEQTTEATTVATTAGTTAGTTAATTADPNVRGEGNTEFVFKVTTLAGESKTFTVRTNKTTVGEALLDAGLIEGEDGPYGLYVKKVDGETIDWDTHGKYWAFHVDGEYSMTGVDSTEIEAGKEYSFKPM